jgi:hypothetical protein
MKDTKNLPPGQRRPPYFDVGTAVVAGRGEAQSLQHWTVCNAREKPFKKQVPGDTAIHAHFHNALEERECSPDRREA